MTVSWGYPTPIGRVNFAEDYTGVLILRRANFPVDKGSVPTDTQDPAMCSVIGSGTVVFDNTSLATSFTDDSSDPCGAPTNDTTWFYKVFLRDQKNYYATQPISQGSVFTEEISGNSERNSRESTEFGLDRSNVFDHAGSAVAFPRFHRDGGLADEFVVWH